MLLRGYLFGRCQCSIVLTAKWSQLTQELILIRWNINLWWKPNIFLWDCMNKVIHFRSSEKSLLRRMAFRGQIIWFRKKEKLPPDSHWKWRWKRMSFTPGVAVGIVIIRCEFSFRTNDMWMNNSSLTWTNLAILWRKSLKSSHQPQARAVHSRKGSGGVALCLQADGETTVLWWSSQDSATTTTAYWQCPLETA